MHASFQSDLYPGPLVRALCEVLTDNRLGHHKIAGILHSLTLDLRTGGQEISKYQPSYYNSTGWWEWARYETPLQLER